MRSLIKFLPAVALVSTAGFLFAKSPVAINADSTQMTDARLSGFTGIKIAGPFEVHLTKGAAESVKYEEPKDVAGRIVAEVEGGVLKIHNKHDNWGQGYKSWYSDKSVWHNHKRILVYITAKNLSAITVSGSGTINFNQGVAAPALYLRLRGSGEITGKIDVKKLESVVSGSGHINLSGNAESSAVRVTGSGHFASPNLVTSNSAAIVSGSGNAEINATDKLDATVHGSGDIKYTGTAKTIKSSKSGSGEINRF